MCCVFLEIITNPQLEVADLSALVLCVLRLPSWFGSTVGICISTMNSCLTFLSTRLIGTE